MVLKVHSFFKMSDDCICFSKTIVSFNKYYLVLFLIKKREVFVFLIGH